MSGADDVDVDVAVPVVEAALFPRPRDGKNWNVPQELLVKPQERNLILNVSFDSPCIELRSFGKQEIILSSLYLE